jgi:hypothetical protein
VKKSMKDFQEAYDAMLDALKAVDERGCSTVYAHPDDEVGEKGCCGELCYHEHAPDCWTRKVRLALEKGKAARLSRTCEGVK